MKKHRLSLEPRLPLKVGKEMKKDRLFLGRRLGLKHHVRRSLLRKLLPNLYL